MNISSTIRISSEFYNVKIDKEIANLSGKDAVTAEFVENKINNITAPDNTNFVKKTGQNIMETGSSILFENNTSSLNINENGISSSLPFNINDKLNISGLNSSINVSSDSSINFLNVLEGENIIKIDDTGLTSNLPIFSKDILFLGKKWRIREDDFGNLLFEYNEDVNNVMNTWKVAVPFNIPFN